MTDQLPPYAKALDIEVVDRSGTAPVIAMPFADKVQGRPGFLHGGAISGLLEMAAVAAIVQALAERDGGMTFKQVNITIDFMRGGTQQMSYAMGAVTRLGRTMANVEATAWQDDPEKPMATASMHYLLRAR